MPTVVSKIMNYWNKYSLKSGVQISYSFNLNYQILVRLIAYSQMSINLDYVPVERARFIQSRPRFGEHYIFQAYIDMINRAQHEIIISNAYFIPIPSINRALENALERGVKVRILTNSKETNDLPLLSEISRTYFYNYAKYCIQTMSDVRIFEWNGGNYRGSTNHAKFAIFDQEELIVGSYNLDPRSEMLNSETVMAFKSRYLANKLREHFYLSDIKSADEVTFGQALRYWLEGKNTLSMKLKLLMKDHL